jgi:hypothetical protein
MTMTAAPKLVENRINRLIQDEKDSEFLGHYHYLKKNNENVTRYLPIPINSEANQIIKKLSDPFYLKR